MSLLEAFALVGAHNGLKVAKYSNVLEMPYNMWLVMVDAWNEKQADAKREDGQPEPIHLESDGT